jgi:hypothetical protein
MARLIFSKSCTMGGRIEFGRFLKYKRFCIELRL